MDSVQSIPVDIALVTAAQMPKPDREIHRLADTLNSQGIQVTVMAWDDPMRWDTIPLVVIRTPWDYFKRLPEFLRWAQHVDSVSRLANPYAIVAWNCHKRYLLDLAQQGVPVVPTRLVQRGKNECSIINLARGMGPEIVIKPAVSIAYLFRGQVFACHSQASQTRRLSSAGSSWGLCPSTLS